MRRTLAVMVVSALTLSLGACGGSAEDAEASYAGSEPENILADAEAALGGLKSVRVVGSSDVDGMSTAYDLAMSREGACTGKVEVVAEGATVEMDVRSNGRRGWVKLGERFYDAVGQGGPKMKSSIGDNWVVARGELATAVGKMCAFEKLVNPGFAGFSDPSKIGLADASAGEAVEVGAIGPDGGDVTVSVLTTEPHHVVRTVTSSDDLVLAAFDEPVDLEVPDKSDVIHLDDFSIPL